MIITCQDNDDYTILIFVWYTFYLFANWSYLKTCILNFSLTAIVFLDER